MADIDVSQIKVFGPGLSAGETGKKSLIFITGAELRDLAEGMSFAVSGPNCKPDMITDFNKPNDDGNAEVFYVPLVPGDYKVTARFRGRQVAGSPFTAKVSGEAVNPETMLTKVTVHGRAYELGKAYSFNEFVVDCSRVKQVIGGLKVNMKGPERSSAQLNIKDNRNGTYVIQYKPTSPGMYSMAIKIAETHIPGSPFEIRVTEFLATR